MQVYNGSYMEISKQLSDETTGLYKSSWQEVYEILKNEILKSK